MHDAAIDTLSQHGKSFRFAGMFLSNRQLHQAARLYRFCRWIDDIADETPDKSQARGILLDLRQQLIESRPEHDIMLDFQALQQELNIPISQPCSLIDGVLSDLSKVAVTTTDHLLKYAYQVAGVVGLMMCPILRADERGYPHAVDLGIAMQLTNIARDVHEDAMMGRRYLPQTWCKLTPAQIVANRSSETVASVQFSIYRLLALAESYYQSACYGYKYLPPRSRHAIAVAANVYRQIGVQLQQEKVNYWQGRTVVKTHVKIGIAVKTLLCRLATQSVPHDSSLHAALKDFETIGVK